MTLSGASSCWLGRVRCFCPFARSNPVFSPVVLVRYNRARAYYFYVWEMRRHEYTRRVQEGPVMSVVRRDRSDTFMSYWLGHVAPVLTCTLSRRLGPVPCSLLSTHSDRVPLTVGPVPCSAFSRWPGQIRCLYSGRPGPFWCFSRLVPSGAVLFSGRSGPVLCFLSSFWCRPVLPRVDPVRFSRNVYTRSTLRSGQVCICGCPGPIRCSNSGLVRMPNTSKKKKACEHKLRNTPERPWPITRTHIMRTASLAAFTGEHVAFVRACVGCCKK